MWKKRKSSLTGSGS